jgi:hypothetical protein
VCGGVGGEQGDKGYALDFPYIVMHAIAGAESSLYGGRACLYCQLDGDDLHEVAFIPSDPAARARLFLHTTHTAAHHTQHTHTHCTHTPHAELRSPAQCTPVWCVLSSFVGTPLSLFLSLLPVVWLGRRSVQCRACTRPSAEGPC